MKPLPPTRDLHWRAGDALADRLAEARKRLEGALAAEPAPWKHLVPFIKGLVLAADVAGSACGQVRAPTELLREALSRVGAVGDWLAVVEHRLSGTGRGPNDFQRAVAQSGPRALVRAGCGAGKTVAAYLWAARHAAGRKLFFCYPTTGTATEGFRDYALEVEELPSALVHSRAEVDRLDILHVGAADTPEDARDGAGEEADRIESLVTWDRVLAVCTVDVPLGLVHNQRRGLFALPSLARSAFVFDEVHSYDSRMWGSLLRLMEALPEAPMLLMSASLPRARRDELQRRFPGLPEVLGPREWEMLPRYVLSDTGIAREAALDEAMAAYTRGERVLWICNTVDRAVEIGRAAEARGARVLPYHSRYRYQDRVHRHQDIISAFGSGGGACIAVTTQVAEMSLDISAELLITELAPAPSLIQRLGRLNRRASPDKPRPPMRALAVRPESAKPYEEEELEQSERFWHTLAGLGRPLSQADLHEALEQLAGGEQEEPRVRSCFLDSGARSPRAEELRQGGSTIPFLRAEDVAGLSEAELRHEQGVRLEIPMLLRREWREACVRRLGFRWVAAEGAILYDEKWGARWAS